MKPSLGRNIWFRMSETVTCAAMIAAVNPDETINLACFDRQGRHFARRNVTVADPGTEAKVGQALWMPYQVGQAEKTKEIAQTLEDTVKKAQALSPANFLKPAAPLLK